MKNLIRIFSLLLVTGLFFTACEEDPGGGGTTDLPPTISVSTTASDVGPGELFTVTVTATAGDADMNDLSIFEEGLLLDGNRVVEISGVTTPNNPNLLFGTDRSGFVFDVTLRAHTDADSRLYSFEVTDDNNNTSTESVFIGVVVEMNPPVFTYNGSPTITDIDPGTLLSIPIDVVAGSVPLASISVLEDGVLIGDVTRLTLGANNFDANPYILEGTFKDSIMDMLFLRAHMDSGLKTYTIVITDENGETSQINLDITTQDPLTPVTELVGVLFNAAGPDGTGGLDLDEGFSTNSDSGLAEIKDFGSDFSEPTELNWLQRIGGVNGYELKYIYTGLPGVPEGFTFGGVVGKEEIVSLWSIGEAFTSMVDNELASFPVEVNDVFVISNGTNYYLARVSQVNVSSDDNGDNYRFDIKF